MQTDAPITVRIDPSLGIDLDPTARLRQVPYDAAGADVIVARGTNPRPPIGREAVVRVGEGGPGWAEVDPDLAIGADGLAGLDLPAAVRSAHDRRLALRPATADGVAAWLGAVRRLLGADFATRVGAGPPTADGPVPDEWVSDPRALDPLALAASDGGVALSSAEELRERFPAAPRGIDGLLAVPLGPRARDGVLVAGVANGGRAWVSRSAAEARAIARATAHRTLLDEARHETDALLRRLSSIGTHDLGNLLFAAKLAASSVERQVGPTASVQKLGRALRSATGLLRRIAEAGADLAEVSTAPAPSRANLGPVLARVQLQLQDDHGARPVNATVADAVVAVAEGVLERLLRILLSNAFVHAEGPIEVVSETVGGRVRIEFVNPGHLPFTDVDAVRPFEHRRTGTVGVGLWVAQRLAERHGVGLVVRQVEDRVRATLDLPLASI